MASTNIEKASLINNVFSENFNSTIPPLSPADLHNFQAETTSSLPDHILCTEEEVVNLVSGLDTGKASGPDGHIVVSHTKTTVLHYVRIVLQSVVNWVSVSKPHLIMLTCKPHIIRGRAVSIDDSML